MGFLSGLKKYSVLGKLHSKKFISLQFIFSVILLGCQQMPTKVTVEEPVQAYTVTAEDLKKSNAVIIDARPAFEYNIAHAPGAINISWQDFTQQDARVKGVLQNDTFSLARRLALIGVDPETPVIVLGKGSAGHGEEGRVAWTLRFLGVKHVYTLNVSAYREQNNNPYKQTPPIKNKPYWKPVIDEGMNIDLKSFKEKTTEQTIIIDVRTANEFALPQVVRQKWKTTKVFNLPWSDFFKKDGLVNAGVLTRLSELGIQKTDEIILISNQGVRSGSVSYALKELGFQKPRNFSGGYNILH